jgi:Calx-beta domain
MIQAICRAQSFQAAAALALTMILSACGGASANSPSTPTAEAAVTAPMAENTAPAAAAPVPEEDFQHRHCSSSQGTPRVSLCASTYSASEASGSVSLIVSRSGAATAAVSVDYATSNGTASAGTDYTATRGTLKWAENDSTSRTIAVPISNAKPFTGSRTFELELTDPSTGTSVGSPGTANVTISGSGSALEGSLQLGAASYTVAQNAGALMVTANRTGGSSGAVSVGYATANGTAVAGKDFTAASGTLKWADGDAAAKSFSVPISNATPFADSKTFSVELTNAGSGAATAAPNSATVTIAGDKAAAVGTLQFGVSTYVVAQNVGTATLGVHRMGGTNGALSISYTAKNRSAAAGADYTATTGSLKWADGDAGVKMISVPISNSTPFTGSKSFTVALSAPSAGAAIGSPGTAAVSISGDGSVAAAKPVGTLMLSAASESVAQNAGSVTVTVDRTGGSSGAVSLTYGEVNGSAVAGTDYTASTGTLKWGDGDAAAKTFSVPVSDAKPFSGSKSFTVDVSGPTGGASLGSPSTASVSIAGNAPAAVAVGTLQLSSSTYSVAQSAGSLSVTVNRTGGSSGAISVNYAVANGSADVGTDFSATGGTLKWASGDAASKTFSVPISNVTAFSGTKTFSVSLSTPAGGATLGSPSSANVTVTGSSVGATTWVFNNGVFNWGGDWSFAASVSYKDTAGAPIEGPYDIIMTSQQWGGWQPFVNGNCQTNISLCFNTTPYKYLIFSAKPTVANQIFGVGFMSSGDTPDGFVPEDTSAYCSGGSNPTVGQWESCKIPLSVFKFTDTTVLKFWISDQTGLSSNHIYLDNIGFTAN